MSETILDIQNLYVEYYSDNAVIKAVNGINLTLKKGQTLGLVGETGAGKTTTALAIMGLLPDKQAKITQGQILFHGQDLLRQTPAALRKIRGKQISMIFQDPMVALNPVLSVGEQIAEVIRLHESCSKAEAAIKAQKMLEMVGIPAGRYSDYPHQFSGGMRQRVVIAISLALNPALLIADEPTTALDVTIQAQVLTLMNNLKKNFDTSMVFITHDLGVVAKMCDTVAIVYCGEIIEYGTLEDIFNRTSHPYTKGLFDSIPDLTTKTDRLKPIPGMIPEPSNLPQGCKFASRCALKTEQCEAASPPEQKLGEQHYVRCFRCGKGEA